MPAAPPPLYTSINDYLSANAGTVGNEQGALAGRVGDELDAAKAGDDKFIAGVKHGDNYSADAGYGDAQQQQIAATQDATTLGSQGGVADLLQKQYASPGYTGTQAGFDASLVGHPASFDALQARGKTLSAYLDQGASAASTPLPPPPPPDAKDPIERDPEPGVWRPGPDGPLRPGSGGSLVPRTSGSAGGQNNGYSPWSFAHGPREPRKDVV
jgi:hypothetical protein